MGANSLIQWTDHTFNPWRGCHKISEGCKNCYAATFVQNRQGLKVWGQDAPRIVAAESTWLNPLKWEREAVRAGVRHRVFCASLADVFEDYQGPDAEGVRLARTRLLLLIAKTPHLDWLLLTKRPENVLKFWPPHLPGIETYDNIWIGCTVENQERAAERMPWLLSIPAKVRFVSQEPQLGPIDWTRIEVLKSDGNAPGAYLNALTGHVAGPDDILPYHVDWIIVGGESGPGARAFDMKWAETTVAQCTSAGVPVFVKQMGARPVYDCPPGEEGEPQMRDDGSARFWSVGFIKDKKGGDMSEWPAELRIRQLPLVCEPTP